MASRFHRILQRRAERAPLTASGHINLVPLVDILTSIVFFSLLTYTGAVMSNLTAFDLALPPVVVTGEQAKAAAPRDTLKLLVAVRLQEDGMRVEHSGGLGGTPFRQDIRGMDSTSLQTLRTTMTEIKQQFPDNKDVLVVPDDGISYDDIVHALEQLKLAGFSSISLGSRERATQVATAAPRGGR